MTTFLSLVQARRALAGVQTLTRARTAATTIHEPLPIEGVILVEGQITGDGRLFEKGALRWNEQQIPIIWDRLDGDHSGLTVGAFTKVKRRKDDTVYGEGYLSATEDPTTAEAITRIRELAAEGVLQMSVSVDQFAAELRVKQEVLDAHNEAAEAFIEEIFGDGPPAEKEQAKADKHGLVTVATFTSEDEVTVFTDARLRHVALLDTAAFPETQPLVASVAVDGLEILPQSGIILGLHEHLGGFIRISSEALTAAAVTLQALPAEHFKRWESKDPTPMRIESDGKIWGHAAGTGCHRSRRSGCLLYNPDTDVELKGFNIVPLQLDDGTELMVGPLTFGGLHADISMTASEARRIHEDGSTVVAYLHAWDDAKGRLCVAGSVVPGLPELTINQLRACAPSYEKWPHDKKGGLTLIGLHMVPMPAHPVAAAADTGEGPVIAVDCMCDGSKTCPECGRQQ